MTLLHVYLGVGMLVGLAALVMAIFGFTVALREFREGTVAVKEQVPEGDQAEDREKEEGGITLDLAPFYDHPSSETPTKGWSPGRVSSKESNNEFSIRTGMA